MLEQMQFIRYHMQVFSYHSPNGCWRHLKFKTSSSDWLPEAPLKDVSNSFDRFSWRWLSNSFSGLQTSLLLKFRVPFLYGTPVWWLLWKFCPKFTLNTCPQVVFIKFLNTKRFLNSSKRHFKQIKGKSVEMAFSAKSLNLDCYVTMVRRNHRSNKIGDFTFPTKPTLSCYFCQLLRYEIF